MCKDVSIPQTQIDLNVDNDFRILIKFAKITQQMMTIL